MTIVQDVLAKTKRVLKCRDCEAVLEKNMTATSLRLQRETWRWHPPEHGRYRYVQRRNVGRNRKNKQFLIFTFDPDYVFMCATVRNRCECCKLPVGRSSDEAAKSTDSNCGAQIKACPDQFEKAPVREG